MNSVLLIIYVILQAADIQTTVIGLSEGKTEANPFLAKLFEFIEPAAAMIIVKIAGIFALWWIDVWQITAIACAVYAWVVANNIKVISGK
jgi:hypothetical protein